MCSSTGEAADEEDPSREETVMYEYPGTCISDANESGVVGVAWVVGGMRLTLGTVGKR